jgi:hypothetical protein
MPRPDSNTKTPLEISVTEEDINNALIYRSTCQPQAGLKYNCPIALAIGRIINQQTSVTHSLVPNIIYTEEAMVIISTNKNGYYYSLITEKGMKLYNFINRFDTNRPVEPFKFILD